MNHSAAIHANAPQPLLSAPLRIATVVAIAIVAVLAVLAALQESHQALRTATGMLARSTVHVTLPSVEVVGRRAPATPIRGGAAS